MPARTRKIKTASSSTQSSTLSSTALSSGAVKGATPPAPWTHAPPGLQGFLDGLSVLHIYITHIDRHPRKLKRNIFIVPVLLNIAVVVLLAWRVKYVAPYYYALLLTFLGQDSPTNIDTANTPRIELINAVMNRTGTLFLDFAIFRFLAPWPYDFFVGESSPSFWRTGIGFQDEEIVVRRSRQWDANLPDGWLAKQEDDGSDAARVWQDRIMPAIDRHWMRAKTGYLMMDKSWDLDFLAMTVATNMVIAGKYRQQDFEKAIFVYSTVYGGWLMWPVYKLDADLDGLHSTGSDGGSGGSGKAEERRQTIVRFKDRLTAMGKENLFFRWIEIVQYESEQPGGFTPERQQRAMLEARRAFEAQGVDFDRFLEDVGAPTGLPVLG